MNLVDENKRLENELIGKRLICELAFNRSDFDQWRRQMPQSFEAWNYPFVAAAMMVGMGIYEYEQGDYWHAFPWLTTPGHQSKWGLEFEKFLVNHETLEVFRTLQEGHRFIAPILAHGGVPQYCLPDFFVLATHHADYDQPSSDFIEFLKSNPSCLQNMDKPIKRFLLHGGEVAEEFVARFLDLWLSLEKDDGGGTYGLPKRVVEAFEEWYSEHAPVLQQRQRKRNRPRAELRIRPGDLGVYLFLPRCDDHPEVGKSKHWMALNKLWATTAPHEIPLSFSDRWVVEIEGRRDILEGITSSLPIMFFDRETGKVIHNPKLRRLPEHLWAICEKTSKINPPPCHLEPLLDWPGYDISVFDLTGLSELQIDKHEFEVRRPFFQVAREPIVRGCSNEKGVPVFFDGPKINWEGSANLTLAIDGDSQGSIDIQAHDFCLLFDEPGEYRFHLRGPLGQNVRKQFILLLGLSFKTRPPVMWPTKESVCLEVSSDGVEFRSENGTLPPFMSEDSKLYFRALTENKEFHLVVEVPSLKWRLIKADTEATEWTNKPLEINVQDMLQWDYPRLIFDLTNIEDNINISLFGRHGVIPQLHGLQSDIAMQNTWAFDLRAAGELVTQSGQAEEFDVLIQDSNAQHLYRGTVLRVQPQWDISDFQAKWKKEDEFHEIHVSWDEYGPLVVGRWLVLIPLWRPWDGTFEVLKLSDHERSSCVWRIRKLQQGRHLIRAVYAPWGCDDWLKAQYICQRGVDVDIENWIETFCHDKDETVRMEDYIQSLLAHWYLPQLMKNSPQIPKDVEESDIRKFLEGLKYVNQLEKIEIPKDGSGALNLFCFNPKATSDAVSNMKIHLDIWKKTLPSQDVLTLEPSQLDKKFIYEIAFQYLELSTETTAQKIKTMFRRNSFSLPLRSWHKNLTGIVPPAGDVIFLCEKFELFVFERPMILDGEWLIKRFRRKEYQEMKLRYQNREAI